MNVQPTINSKVKQVMNPEVFPAVLVHAASCDFAVALILTICKMLYVCPDTKKCQQMLSKTPQPRAEATMG